MLTVLFYYVFRTIPNCEHSVAGHAISLAFDIRAFFLSLVQVRFILCDLWEKLIL